MSWFKKFKNRNNKDKNKNGKNSGKITKVRVQVQQPKILKDKYTQKDVIEYELPLIRGIQRNEKRKKLVITKLRLCCVIFDFVHLNDIETKGIEIKRAMLVEIVEYISSVKWWNEDILKELIDCMKCNLFRTLPIGKKRKFVKGDEEEEPFQDPSWLHLQLIYELCLRFLISNDINKPVMQKYLQGKFVLSIIQLFQSEDMRERDYLKTILHRIYGKFMSFRSFLRRAINNVFYHVIYVTQKHNGLAELLEILGSIINGFATPLKDEHQRFLRNVLVPLHKVKTLSQFHAQLAYCVVQFIEKDPKLSSLIIGGLLKFWPQTSCSKELLYLSELEEVLEMTDKQSFEKFIHPVFQKIADCICSPHFQVAERALFLWNNDVIANFMSEHRPQILPLLYPALYTNIETHWNPTVTQLTKHIMQQFADMDVDLFEKVKKNHEKLLKLDSKLKKRKKMWKAVHIISQKNNKLKDNNIINNKVQYKNNNYYSKSNGVNTNVNNKPNIIDKNGKTIDDKSDNKNHKIIYKNGVNNSNGVIQASLNIQ